MGTPLTPHRHTERISSDRAALNHLLDTCLVATISSVVDGSPWALPVVIGRHEDTVILHGSTGGGLLRHLVDGAPAVVSAYAVDGMVMAPTWLNHSLNYRSAVLTGTFSVVEGEEKYAAMAHVMDGAFPERSTETPRPSAKDAAATLVLTMPIEDGTWTFKQRSGDTGLPVVDGEPWQGVVPGRMVWGPAEPAEGQSGDVATPACFDHYNIPT